jgi:hypothetical protein
VERLRPFGPQVKDGAEKLDKCLDQMMMNAWLGRNVAAKTRAGVAWARWRDGKGEAAEVTRELLASVEAMESLADLGEKLYGGLDIHTYRPTTSRPWPWTNLQIWNLDQWRKHDWRTSAGMFRRELEWVRREIDARYPQPLLPFEDDLAAPPHNARLLLEWDCEGEPPAGLKLNHFPPAAEAAVADAGGGQAPLAGRRIVASQGSRDGFYFPIQTDPSVLPLEIGRRYFVTVDYWITKSADELGEWLSAGARTTEGGWRRDIGARYMGGPAGTRGQVTLSFTPVQWKDFYVYVSMHGASAIELDNVRIWVGDEEPVAPTLPAP